MINVYLRTSNGKTNIVKYYPSTDPNWEDRKRCESEDLQLLSSCGLFTPSIIQETNEFIEMENILPIIRPRFPIVAKNLKAMYDRTEKKDEHGRPSFGFHRDGFYGPSRFVNGWYTSWWEFFGISRFDPLLLSLQETFPDWDLLPVARFLREKMCYLGEPSRSVLLHGDLFRNNILDTGENIFFIDPACFYGDELYDYAKIPGLPKSIKNHPRRKFYIFYYSLHFYWFTNGRELRERPKIKDQVSVLLSELLPLVPGRGLAYLGGLVAGSHCIEQKTGFREDFSAKIGLVYIGAFNPPHPNHLGMLSRASSAFPEVSVLGIVVCTPVWYLEKKNIPEHQRLSVEKRQKLLVSGLANVGVTFVVMSYVMNHKMTFRILSSAFPEMKFFCVCGSELEVKKKVENCNFLDAQVPLVVVERYGHPIVESDWEQDKREVIFVRGQEAEWSSTRIRSDLQLWQDYT